MSSSELGASLIDCLFLYLLASCYGDCLVAAGYPKSAVPCVLTYRLGLAGEVSFVAAPASALPDTFEACLFIRFSAQDLIFMIQQK